MTAGDTGNSVFGGAVTGSGGLTKTGAGTLTLSVANGYTAVTTVSGGTVRLGSAASLGAAGSTVVLQGTTPVLGAPANTGTTFNGNVTVSAEALILSDRATAGAGLTQTLGTLSIGTQALIGNPTISVNTSGTGVGTLSISATVAAGANSLTFSGPGNATFLSTLTGSGTLTRQGGGALLVSTV